MSMRQRAAQFSPFAALVGYEDVIDETAPQTDSKRELDEIEKEELDRKLCVIESAKQLKSVMLHVIDWFFTKIMLKFIDISLNCRLSRCMFLIRG